ncbi:glutamate--tRNA ligase [Acetobacteraceae bacterium]|nr:glutamate--tRNA ligase [Acetobacteraceae bacterium]
MKLRFAPSPTGRLHVGNARLAVANYLFARHHKATLLLRVDDTDAERNKAEYEESIRHDLKWLGIDWDEEARQSDRKDRYQQAIERLKESGRLYPCFEGEEELKYKREQKLKAGLPPVYDRAMLSLTAEQRQKAEENGKKPYWRFKLSDRVCKWDDLIMGQCHVPLRTVSDPIVVREDGEVLYSLASIVDDMELGVTHIIRGQDHVGNTGVQIELAEALGAKPNQFTFAHFPLLLDGEGKKFSKRRGVDASLAGLRRDGFLPEAIISFLATLGSSQDSVLRNNQENIAHFDLSTISKASPRFEMSQLIALNRKAWHEKPYAEAKALLPEGTSEAFWNAIRGNIELGTEIAHWVNVVQGELVIESQAGEESFFDAAIELLPEAPWTEETWKAWTNAIKEKTGNKGKALFHPLRLALTDEDSGPEMRLLLPLIGRERVLSRLKSAKGSV